MPAAFMIESAIMQGHGLFTDLRDDGLSAPDLPDVSNVFAASLKRLCQRPPLLCMGLFFDIF